MALCGCFLVACQNEVSLESIDTSSQATLPFTPTSLSVAINYPIDPSHSENPYDEVGYHHKMAQDYVCSTFGEGGPNLSEDALDYFDQLEGMVLPCGDNRLENSPGEVIDEIKTLEYGILITSFEEDEKQALLPSTAIWRARI